MGDVSVIGAGAMGSALVRTLAAAGADVTVWNRTRQRAEDLAGPRVTVAETAGEALTSSQMAIVSVTDHELARSLVAGAGVDLDGGVIVSTSFVTPEQARVFADAVATSGGRYLDLSIAGYPSDVEGGSAFTFVSGDRAAFETNRDHLEPLGAVTFVDDAPGAAFVSEMAILLPYLPMAVSLLQSVRICERHGLPLGWLAEAAGQLYPFHIRKLLDRALAEADLSEPEEVEASVRVWGDGAAEYAAYLREMDLDAGMYDALHRLFEAGIASGRGDEDWTVIAEVTAAD